MNYDMMNNNKLSLTGKIAAPLVFTHEVLGEDFTKRGSSEEAVGSIRHHPAYGVRQADSGVRFREGETITVEGQFRSHNKVEGGRSRLVLTAFARDVIYPADESINPNLLEVSGYICKSPCTG